MWSSTPEEYEHVRSIMLGVPFGGNVEVTLLSGKPLKGALAGTSSRNNSGQNIKAGRGPVVTSIFGEISLLLKNRHTIVLNALEIQSIATVTAA